MSKVLPFAIQDRPELNLRQGIKSSLNNWRQLLSSLYLFFLYLRDGGSDAYCKEIQEQGRTYLSISDSFAQWLTLNWNSITSIDKQLAKSPLFLAQMEHLQVGLELFLKLAKVEFADSSLSDASERTGGNRYCKKLHFSTNMKICADAISRHPKNEVITFLEHWLSNTDDSLIGEQVKEILVPFTEECQYKIRTNTGEVYFQQNGVYERLRNPADTVESSDTHEPVGPFRILKSFIKEGMHPYLIDSSDGFKVKSDIDTFSKYADLVNTSLMLIPKRTTVLQEVAEETPPKESQAQLSSRQLISYGAPGTGKSFNIDKIVNDKGCVHFRTTFHPDSDYASFVGCYKPVVKEYDRIVALGKKIENAELDAAVPDELRKERKIEYTFVEQAFTKAYVAAWKNKAAAIVNGGQAAEPVYLIIEEINRGNCAQVFGDIFQLLDREGGFSKYPICADDDLHRHLEGVFKGLDFGSQYAKVQTGEELVLPDNLYIWATMNTSDQSLFPMDSAFKRRWDWEYVPISEGVDENTQKKLDWNIVVKDVEKQPDGTEKEVTVLYSWWHFLQIINTKIYHLTDSEDKELGYFFAKPDSAEGISAKLFVNKVVFYLWTDVYKNYGVDNIFKGSDNGATTEEEKAKGVPFRQFFDETGKNANTVTLKNFFKTIGLKAVEGGGLEATALP